MDDDLEEELLAVAGRRPTAASSRKRDRPASDDDDQDESDDNLFDSEGDDEEEPRKKAPVGGGKRAPLPPRRGSGKGPRYEEPEDDGDGYGSDDLYEDEEDRLKLEAMNELEREMTLADRAEQRDKERQRRELLKHKPGKEQDQTEVRASSRRPKAVTDTDTAIRKLTAVRERKEKADAQRARQNAAATRPPREVATKTRSSTGSARQRDWSDSEDEGDGRRDHYGDDEYRVEEEVAAEQAAPLSEDEEGERSPSSSDRLPAPEGNDDFAAAGALRPLERPVAGDDEDDDEREEAATHDEVKTIQLLRSQLEAWEGQPFFTGTALAGCVVRMAYGGFTRHPQTKEEVAQYLTMVITDVKDGHKYPFGAKSQLTDKHLVVKDGLGISRVLAMSNVSNQAIQDWEHERYLRHCERAKETPLSKADVVVAQQKIKEAANFRWDASAVQARVQSKRGAGVMAKNYAAEKARLKLLRDSAQAEGRLDEVDRYDQQVRDLEARVLEDKQPGGQRSFGMSHINKRNTDQNFKNAFQNVSNQVKGAIALTGGHAVDAFSRRVTRPNIYWNTGKSKVPALPNDGATALEQPLSTKLKANELRMDPTELLQTLDIDVDISLLQDHDTAPPLAKRLLGPHWQAALHSHATMDLSDKMVLSVADWKRRVGMV